MRIKIEIKKLLNYAALLLLSIGLIAFVMHNDTLQFKDLRTKEIAMQKAVDISLDILLTFVHEKSSTEIALNTNQPDKKLQDHINKYTKLLNDKISRFSACYAENVHLNERLKFLKHAIIDFKNNVQTSRQKILDDIKREKKILDINEWSVFAHKLIQKFKNDIGIVNNKNYFAEINFAVYDILINLCTEYVMHNILLHKNIKDYLVVLTANTTNNIENSLRNIKNIIEINNIQNTQITSNYKNLCDIYKKFHEKTINNSSIDIGEFQIIVDSIIPQIKFLNIQENSYLRTDVQEDDNINKLLLAVACAAVGIVLILLVIRYLIVFFKFSKLTNEDVARYNYKTLGFISDIMDTAKEYIENFSYSSKNIDISNIVPITSINTNDEESPTEYVSENAFNDICTIVREINLCNSKIFDNIKFMKEKANSLNFKREKLCEIANFNLSKDINEEMKQCMREIDAFYKLDSFEAANEITAAEFSYLFEKFHELSFKADNVKNVFLELVSEIKLLTLNSAIENTDSKKIANKLQGIIDNVLNKINTVKMFTSEANKVYSKTNSLLSTLVKIAKEIEDIQNKLDGKMSVSKASIEKFFNHFKTICTHYELILGNSNIEKNELDNLLKILNNTKLQIENTNTKVNNIISNVESHAQSEPVKSNGI